MNERLQEMLDIVQRTAEDAASAATDMAYTVGKKTTQLLEVGKLNIKVVDLKTEIHTNLREIGEMIYATHTGNPSESDALLEKLQTIDGLQEQIRQAQEQIAMLQGGNVCKTCGAASHDGDVFCRDCGMKL